VRTARWGVLALVALGCSGAPAKVDGGDPPCQLVIALDRSCGSDADCVAVHHATNCCGGLAWIGIHVSEQQRFASLETQCRASFPPCGCADSRDSTDDGSRITPPATAAAFCEAGLCKTYAAACGHACPAGSSCRICTDAATGVVASSCAPQCTSDATCTDPAASHCNQGYTSGLCSPAGASCDLPN
jgi:hypothetical protein